MIRSMTGFGQAERTASLYRIRVELKAVNHRFLEAVVRLPREWLALEETVKRTVQQKLKRGRIDAFVTLDRDRASGKTAVVNWPLAEAYADAARQLKERFSLEGLLSLQQLLSLPDLIALKDDEVPDFAELERAVEQCTSEAVDSLMAMRMQEGRHLEEDLHARLSVLSGLREAIWEQAPKVVAEYRAKLTDRVKELLGTVPADENRLAQEVAVFADRSSIDEELTRLKSHFVQSEQLLVSEEPAGRKLDFLIQEMNREVNTIGSKAGYTAIINAVVEMKAELEKMREQVQNVE